MLRRSTLIGSTRLIKSVKTTRSINTLLLAVLFVVCLSPVQAQDSAAAKVLTLTGDVSYIKDGPAGNKWALNEGQTVQQRWIIKTGKDGYAKFQVADGSTFEVFPDSEVTFRQDPGNWTHLLNVWIGHIKVMIQHLPGVANPNNVTSPTAVISVRGTVFEVVVEDLNGTTLVSVDEGLVQVHHRMQPGNDKFLNAGDSVRVFPNEPLAKAGGAGNFGLQAIKKLEQAIYDGLLQRGIPGGGTVPTGSGGTQGTSQGDKGKNKGGSGGGAPVPPGAAPAPPGGAPPPPPPPGGGD
jgi:hypothetical protein